jgi:hypothetical protein
MGDYHPWKQVAVRDGYDIKWSCEVGTVYGRAGTPQLAHYLFDQYGQLAANAVRWGSGAAPTAGAVYPFTIPQDNFNPPRKIFWHNKTRWFIEVFPNLNQSDLLYFIRLPMGIPRNGLISVIGNLDGAFRWPYGINFWGRDSDIDNPTDAGKFWVPAGVDLEVAVVNTINERVRPQTDYIMNQFSFQPYNPLTEGGKRHILNILRGSPVSDGSAGGMNQFDMPIETFKETYGVYPTTVEEGCKVYYLNGSIEAKVLIGEI